MNILIACGIILIVLILFYRFVERQHKILIFKILGGIIGISAIAIGGYLIWQNKIEKDKKHWATVKQSYIYDKASKQQRDKLAQAAFEETKKVFAYRFQKMSSEQIDNVKNFLLLNYLDTAKSVRRDLVRSSSEETKISLDSIFAKESEKAAILEKLKPFELKRVDQYITEMTSWKEDDPWVPFILRAWILSFETTEAKTRLEAKIPPEYKKSALWVENMEKYAEHAVQKRINDDKTIETAISFNICNSRKVPLDLIKFDVSGYEEGRSTPISIMKDNSSYQTNSTSMESDIIIEGEKCISVTWTGKYLFFDKYVVKWVDVKWHDGESMMSSL